MHYQAGEEDSMKTLLLGVAAALPSVLGAQDTARTNPIRQLTDSIRAETCRGGKLSLDGLSCSGAKHAPRDSVIRRLANRVDYVMHTRLPAVVTMSSCTPPVCNPGSPGNVSYAVTLLYNSLFFGFPPIGSDTVTMCAMFESSTGMRKLAWPPVHVRTVGDSSSWSFRDREPLSKSCAAVVKRSGLPVSDSLVVTWVGDWVTLGGRRVWRPFPSIP